MKERALELRKEIVHMKDAWEELTIGERNVVEDMEKELDKLTSDMNDIDRQWVENEFGKWYEKYLEVETKVFIKPHEG
ncbi:hypothetical protein [Limisalsivibrio acetivorans]|uniref:hypothetical protein n=1 Tax=Limisalsivibrio acetivorans TaxID=1304888 RepID=UPI0003B40C09|nr:hypothetical protein [Limisalsivibrio acetivorans]